MRSNNDVGSDLKAVAQDVLQMGARCVQAGRAWLTDRRNEMTDRNDEYRPGNPSTSTTRPAAHAQGRDHDDWSSARGQQGSREYSGYTGRQAGEGYGRSSGYGNPEHDRYGGDSGYRGTPFVSPADTQQSHSGLGRQSYSGVGPKNYTRSDERITEDLCERLTQDHDIDASELEVKITSGMATLEGTVPQRWMKHRAEDLADDCAGVRNVENRIKVQSAASYSGPSTQHDVGGGTDTLAGKAGGPGGIAH